MAVIGLSRSDSDVRALREQTSGGIRVNRLESAESQPSWRMPRICGGSDERRLSYQQRDSKTVCVRACVRVRDQQNQHN
jgi:hypothetical protein